MSYSVNVSSLGKDADEQEILKYIYETVKKNYEKGPTRSYLLQCGDWAPSYFHKYKWIPYSPVGCRSNTGVWPIYQIDVEYTDDQSTVEFQSWKGDYESRVEYAYGNLPLSKKTRNFKGTVWTRGE